MSDDCPLIMPPAGPIAACNGPSAVPPADSLDAGRYSMRATNAEYERKLAETWSDRNFNVSLGAGATKLFAGPVVPTIKLLNVGWAF